jgi:hypothetical protein
MVRRIDSTVAKIGRSMKKCAKRNMDVSWPEGRADGEAPSVAQIG